MKSKIVALSFLITIFIAITLLIINNNSFVINLDNAVHSSIANHQSPFVYNFMLSITKICDIYGTIIIFMIFGLFLFLKNSKSFYIFTLATSSGVILTEIIKYLIQRVRPYNLIENGFSFPSAHAMIATVFLFSSIYLLTPLIKKGCLKNTFVLIVFIVFPLVAFSRIYLSVHFVSDVVAGVILGSICFILSGLICCHKKENVL